MGSFFVVLESAMRSEKKNNYFCDVGARSARRWYWGRYHHGTKTNNDLFSFFFRARLRLVILVILVISAIRAQETGSVGCFAAQNEDTKQYDLIPPKRVLFFVTPPGLSFLSFHSFGSKTGFV